MSQSDSKKRTRKKTKKDDDSLKPKKSRVAEGVSQGQTSKKWTSKQRLQLVDAVLKHVKIPWDDVSNEVDGEKNGRMCYDQWRRFIVPSLKTFIKSEHE